MQRAVTTSLYRPPGRVRGGQNLEVGGEEEYGRGLVAPSARRTRAVGEVCVSKEVVYGGAGKTGIPSSSSRRTVIGGEAVVVVDIGRGLSSTSPG